LLIYLHDIIKLSSANWTSVTFPSTLHTSKVMSTRYECCICLCFTAQFTKYVSWWRCLL